MSAQQARAAGPARQDARGRDRRNGTAEHSRQPGTILIAGDTGITGTGATFKSPAAGPAAEMLDRLWDAVGNNGLVMIGPETPSWSYLLQEPGPWKIAGGPAWFTVSQGDTRLRLVLLDQANPSNDPLFGPDYLTTVTRHHRFAGLTGVPFFADGGSTSALLMEQLVSVRGRYVLRSWKHPDAPRLAEPSWLGPWERADYGATVRLDKNAYYLSAANAAQLPVDGLKRTGPAADPKTSVGVWQIKVPENPDPHLPHPIGGGRVRPGEHRWVAHPTMELLAELGARVEVMDSWTCPRTRARRLLVPWYERLREARTAARAGDDGDALALQRAIKDTYSRGIGCLDRDNRRWHRPDWRAIIYAQARCNMYRRLLQVGREHRLWPVLVRTDSVLYEGSEPPPGFKMGTGMGEWKVISK